ncbi:MAG TPA: FAD-dependent oxidoreductase, partial [Pyrinomonadaceae bacterium]|nr:FAD-dependent oxidoreductase [Pyrinomonadaceae bacterium]
MKVCGGIVVIILSSLLGSGAQVQATGNQKQWARGAAYYKPGQFSTLLPHVARPEGRIHFAGEHTSVWIDGWM